MDTDIDLDTGRETRPRHRHLADGTIGPDGRRGSISDSQRQWPTGPQSTIWTTHAQNLTCIFFTCVACQTKRSEVPMSWVCGELGGEQPASASRRLMSKTDKRTSVPSCQWIYRKFKDNFEYYLFLMLVLWCTVSGVQQWCTCTVWCAARYGVQ